MINADKIQYILSEVINVLRGKYVLAESIDCALKLLFCKRLSDQSRTQERTQLSVPDQARWSVLEGEQKDLAKKLNEVLTAIEIDNSQLEGIFTNLDINFWSRFSDVELHNVIQHISELDLNDKNFDNSDELGKAFEELIEKRASIEGYKGKIYTPRHVTKMMLELINPQQETSIYDPVCGSGEFLAESVNFIKNLGGDLSQLNIYGQDADIQECAIAKINLIVHGLDNTDIHVGDAILEFCFDQNNKPKLFDIVLTNPPFNFKYDSECLEKIKYYNKLYNLFPYGIPRNGVGEYLLIQYILSSLADQGKAAVILPRGVLFREGDERDIRKSIIEADLIEAVIEMAPKLFSNVSIPVVIMIFNRKKYHKNKILFIDASREYEARRGQNFLQPEHINRIVCTYRRLEDEEGFAKLVNIEEIAENKYNLSVDRYVIPLADEKIDIASEVSNLHRLEAERSELERKIDDYLRDLGIEI